MQHRIYSLYLSTYLEAGHALSQRDEEHMRRLCASVSNRSGLESMLAMMALSDAETGRRPRTKGQVSRVAWTRGEVVANGTPLLASEYHPAPERAA